MAEKIQRQTQKIFGGNAPVDDIAVMGSFKTGTPVYTDDISALQNEAYEEGYSAALVANEAPFLEEQNSVPYVLSKQLAYLFQEGIPEYDSETAYYIGSVVKSIEENKIILYQSLTDNNIGNALTDTESWQEVSFGSSSSSGTSLPLGSTIVLDHVLSYEESKGLALQGTYVYKTSAPERYGYPDFYAKYLAEYQNPLNTTEQIKMYDKSNVTKVGNILDDNGLISNFSASNYAATPQIFNPQDKTWEMVFKVKLSAINGYNIIFSRAVNTYYGFRLEFGDGTVYLISSFADDKASYTEIQATFAQTVNTDYWVKAEYTGTDYNVYTSTDGENYTLAGTKTSNGALYDSTSIQSCIGFNISSSTFLNGSIDLTESYINIDGERWWSGVDYLTATVKKNPNKHIFFDISEKNTIDAIYNKTGIADMYGIDTANERIFLPRDKYFAHKGGTMPVVGTNKATTFTNGTTDFNLGSVGFGNGSVILRSLTTQIDNIGANVGDKVSGYVYGSALTPDNTYIGISKDPENSGLEAHLIPSENKYLYYIVGNTEVESAITDVTEITTSENDTIPLFTPLYFNFKPNNPSWLKAGGQVNSAGIYTSTYNKLVESLTNNISYIKVVDVDDMISGVDYSEYWKVNQTEMWFKTPEKLAYGMLNPTVTTLPVKGNGMALGLQCTMYQDGNGGGRIHNFGLSTTAQSVLGAYESSYGQPVDFAIPQNINFPSSMRSLGVTTEPEKSGVVAEVSGLEADTAQLYFKVANAVQNLELLNVGEVLEALSDKIGKEECKAYITETYRNGVSGYNVYSNGYCEQWGTTANNVESIDFLKQYASTDYTVFAEVLPTNDNIFHAMYTKTNNGITGLKTRQAIGGTTTVANYWYADTSWRAYGFIS